MRANLRTVHNYAYLGSGESVDCCHNACKVSFSQRVWSYHVSPDALHMFRGARSTAALAL